MELGMIREKSWIGDMAVSGRIRGVALVFHDLGRTEAKASPNTVELEWAKAGWLVVFPYYGPWSWMNRQARSFVDNLVDAVYEQFELSNSIPLAATGNGMGGLAALLYARYSRRAVSACMVLAPVCDLANQCKEKPELARSIHHAFLGYEENEDILYAEHSPLAQAAQMPDIPYLIIHGDQDQTVSKAAHSDKLVAALRGHGRRIEYMEITGMGHDSCVPMIVPLKMIQFLARLPNKPVPPSPSALVIA